MSASYLGSHAGPQAHGYGNGPIFVVLGAVGSNGVKPAENVAITITHPHTNIKIRLFIVALSDFLLERKLLRRESIRQTWVHVQR